ncbi:NADP-dependent oxidoreductase domain-containing protein [Gloeopeniophorella convolvens]|nr:NADP-dependent oxidoreductase domain-containing protein [Gloeopeniophorella convolvens]
MASVVLKRTGQKNLRRTDRILSTTSLGLWKISKSECADVSRVPLLDGAGDYGNEKEAGEGVRRAIQDGIIKREELCTDLSVQLWNTFHAHDHAKAAARMQLDLWGIDYFDLFLVHFPVSLAYVDPKHRYPPEWWADDGKTVNLQNTPYQETWQAMEELVDEGLAKNIGISNVGGSLIVDILRYARIEPQLAKTLGIAVTGYSSFGPQSYLELGFKGGVKSLFEQDPVVKAAQAHGRGGYPRSGQVLLRWATQRGIAVLPKTNAYPRLVSNLDVNSFDLTESEIQAISALNINLRLNDPAEIDPRIAIFA